MRFFYFLWFPSALSYVGVGQFKVYPLVQTYDNVYSHCTVFEKNAWLQRSIVSFCEQFSHIVYFVPFQFFNQSFSVKGNLICNKVKHVTYFYAEWLELLLTSLADKQGQQIFFSILT